MNGVFVILDIDIVFKIRPIFISSANVYYENIPSESSLDLTLRQGLPLQRTTASSEISDDETYTSSLLKMSVRYKTQFNV